MIRGYVHIYYSRTSFARTLMTRLPRLFRTRSFVPWKNSIAAKLDNQGWFLCWYWKWYTVGSHKNRLHETILMRTHNIPSCYRKSKIYPYYASWAGLWLTLISSSSACLEHIFMVPKVFEPLKFCIYAHSPFLFSTRDMSKHLQKWFVIYSMRTY